VYRQFARNRHPLAPPSPSRFTFLARCRSSRRGGQLFKRFVPPLRAYLHRRARRAGHYTARKHEESREEKKKKRRRRKRKKRPGREEKREACLITRAPSVNPRECARGKFSPPGETLRGVGVRGALLSFFFFFFLSLPARARAGFCVTALSRNSFPVTRLRITRFI